VPCGVPHGFFPGSAYMLRYHLVFSIGKSQRIAWRSRFSALTLRGTAGASK